MLTDRSSIGLLQDGITQKFLGEPELCMQVSLWFKPDVNLTSEVVKLFFTQPFVVVQVERDVGVKDMLIK